MNAPDMDPAQKAQAWRARLGLDRAPTASAFESAIPEARADEQITVEDRIDLARAQMRELVQAQFGGDQALMDGVEALVIGAREAAALLQADLVPATSPNWISLEAVVAFDGSRPSFLIKNGEVQLDSSLSIGRWRDDLSSFLPQLGDLASCVGRVERGETHIGTAFLIGPDLALTNRHVVQSISFAGEEGRQLYPGIGLDFGREYQGRDSYDRREVVSIVAMGVQAIDMFTVDHGKLDLALLRVTPSSLPGALKHRFLGLSKVQEALEPGLSVVTAGYPAAWRESVPEPLQTAHASILAQLLAGDGGCKRLSPGLSQGMLAADGGATSWTGLHDATTLRGNSGSPMAVLGGASLKVRGLHYGGVALGDRVNWIHLLARCADAPCLPLGKRLGEILAAEGVEL